MVHLTNLCLCVFSEILLASIAGLHLRSNGTSLSDRIYDAILYSIMIMLVVDLGARCDGLVSPAFPAVNAIGNFLLFVFNPLFPVLWYLYAHNQVFCDDHEIRRLVGVFSAPFALNALLTILSLNTGWYYYIDSGNIYHRGPFFIISVVINQVIMVSAFLLLIVNRKRMERKYFYALMSMGLLPALCVVLQVTIYGISFTLNGMAVSMVVAYMNIQDKRMNVDYLTGAFNRQQLDYLIEDKIRRSSRSRSFSAILLDMDNFKTINDNFGHCVGDDALRATAAILKDCIRRNDFLARFGGDEFYLILDITETEMLLEIVERINRCIRVYNKSSGKPYQLSLSMGYSTYDVRSGMSAEEFQAQIDRLMYFNKEQNKARLSIS